LRGPFPSQDKERVACLTIYDHDYVYCITWIQDPTYPQGGLRILLQSIVFQGERTIVWLAA
jgi:hypothetical protein